MLHLLDVRSGAVLQDTRVLAQECNVDPAALQIPRETVNLQMDMAILVEAFVVVVVGGLGSVTGALWASLAIGLLQTFAVGLDRPLLAGISLAQVAPMLPFLLMVLMLIFRPRGLMGTRDG